MATPQRIANWQVLRPVGRVGRLNKYIDIPTFSQQCFKLNRSIYLSSLQTDPIGANNWEADGSTGFTFECWIKNISPVDTIEQVIANNINVNSLWSQWKLSIIEGRLRFTWLDPSNALHTIDSDSLVPHGEWCHLAVSYSSAEIKFYINGLNISTVSGGAQDFYQNGVYIATLPEPVDLWINGASVLSSTLTMKVNANPKILFGSTNQTPQTQTLIGYLAELRYWDVPQSDTDIEYKHNKPRNIDAVDTIDGDLTYYISGSSYSFDGTFYSIYDELDPINLITTTTENPVVSDEFPTLIYGASFIPIVFHVVAPQAHSLKFPNIRVLPNFGLCVSWTDDFTGEFRRKYIFMPSGVDINPPPEEYKGDNLPAEYDIEVWNIDGIDTISNNTVINIKTSVTAAMQSITDTAGVALTTLTEDTLLAEPFPFANFPLEFNTQQTY